LATQKEQHTQPHQMTLLLEATQFAK